MSTTPPAPSFLAGLLLCAVYAFPVLVAVRPVGAPQYDPDVWWHLRTGQLILQHTKGADGLWKKDVVGNKAKADKYWPPLVAAKAGKKDPVDSLLGKSVLDLAKIN